MSFATIPEILEELRDGRMVVILDDEDRENEGDLIMAAEKVRAEDINFMAREARGLICLALTAERCRQLGLGPMVQANNSPFHTNFTVSIEAAKGVTTGISAQDRAHTVRTAVRSSARPDDLTQPGHVFPLMAAAGGVLIRAGHTEAATDLPRLAGCEPAGVLVEVLHEDGSMARRPELEVFAAKHGLKIATIADLIRFRLANEKTIARVHEEHVLTEFGAFRLVAFRDVLFGAVHFALVRGNVDDGAPVLTRVHVQNTLSDVLHLVRKDLAINVTSALSRVASEDRGIVVVLAGDESPDALVARLRHGVTAEDCALIDSAAVDAAESQREWRQLGLGAQILADLGVRKLRVLGTPRRLVALGGFGLEVVEQVDDH
ncbi:MAG: 3,4-dihydroxy-2-butanone-4-phosphate synthase [Rhodanobacteraceae bacterium]